MGKENEKQEDKTEHSSQESCKGRCSHLTQEETEAWRMDMTIYDASAGPRWTGDFTLFLNVKPTFFLGQQSGGKDSGLGPA